jgi:hypothetical protein
VVVHEPGLSLVQSALVQRPDWADEVETGWTEQKSQGTAATSMDQIPHLAKVVAVPESCFRSIVAGQTRFFHPEPARVLGSSGLNPSNRDGGAVGLSLRARTGR